MPSKFINELNYNKKAYDSFDMTPAKVGYVNELFAYLDGVIASSNVFLGENAGFGTDGIEGSNFIGYFAGGNSIVSNYSNFIGFSAGFGSEDTDNCNFFGKSAGEGSTGNNVNAFGEDAGLDNALNGQTIFSNASMPSYTNHAAAAAAITILNGASRDSTYLYHNQATNSIGAVRL
jgi:hypothetical protein